MPKPTEEQLRISSARRKLHDFIKVRVRVMNPKFDDQKVHTEAKGYLDVLTDEDVLRNLEQRGMIWNGETWV